ncbi:MAG: DUF1648 domain-containing protein [Candidatus Acidiferrales bacterium]
MDSRIPKLFFGLLVLCAAVHFSYDYPQLPGVMASHFDAHGVANGWQTKSAFFGVLAWVTVIAAFLVFGIPWVMGALPARFIHLPNKDYWLAPRQWASSRRFLGAWFAWFGCAVFTVIVLAFDYAVKSNLPGGYPRDPARLWRLLAGFAVFTLVWAICMFRRFGRPPGNASPLQ